MKKIKNPLIRRIPKELIGDWKKYLVVFLFLVLTIGFVSGMYVANESMITSANEGVTKYKQEDGHFELKKQADAVEKRFGRFLDRIKWLNMGGGHLMTHKDYDCDELIRILQEFKAKYPNLRLILEPGSAFTWRTGYLVSTVEDIVENGGVRTAMLDVSFACHMPDCLEMPYKPAILGARDPEPGEKGWRMGGNSCLAGDYYGDWIFDRDLRVGDRIVFEDMIHYTMVKTTMFNGVAHPAIAIVRRDGAIEIIREFGYEDFKSRMS